MLTRTEAVRALAIAHAICACATNAAGIADEMESLNATIASNSVSRQTSCEYYRKWYAGLCSKEEHAAILSRNIAAHRRKIELEPWNAGHHSDLGCVLAAVGRWKEAKAELGIAIAAGDKLDLVRRAKCRWEMANCLWKEGDRNGAKKLVAEVAAMDWMANYPDPYRRAQYLHRAWTDPDGDLDVFTLPHSTDDRPFPMPQEAKYGEKRLTLAKVEIKFKTNETAGTGGTSSASRSSPVSPADPIIRLLKRKLTRFGSTFAKDGTPILIELSPNAPVEKPEGYSLDVANGKVIVKARERLGALWGVVSFIQCIDRDALAICECEIRDWPVCPRRGVIDLWDKDFLEFALFNKMSSATVRILEQDYVPCPLDRERIRIWSARFRDYGIEMYGVANYIAMMPMLPLSSPRTWKLHLGWARFLASCGMGLSFHLDDMRFPMHPADIEAAGTAANLDAKYLTKLYREVKKDHPDFIMQFCPPFYWGPDGGVNYPEPRDPYLKSLAADLDPAIDVYWTGPRVKSGDMRNDATEWFSGLIGRKPTIFHNGDCIGRHNGVPLGADPTGYKKSHSRGLFDRIASFQRNMGRMGGAPSIGSCMDWCWNPDAHDSAKSVKRTDEQLVGPGVYEILKKATPRLEYFDKYIYGRLRSEVLLEDQADLDSRIADSEAAWSNVLAIAKNDGLFVSDFKNCCIAWAKMIAEGRRNPPEWLIKQRDAEMANVSFAISEVGYDAARGDEFIPAELLSGGYYVAGMDHGKRNVKFLDVQTEISGRFNCDQFPPQRPFKLIATGIRWNLNPVEVEVEVNGRVIYKGKAFDPPRYAPMELEIPVDALQRSNRFVIRNTAPADESHRKPEIHYVVIRK